MSQGNTTSRRTFLQSLSIAVLALACFSFPGLAPAAEPSEALKRWNSLSDSEREELRRRYEELKAMPAEEREELREALRRFKALTDAQKQKVEKNYEAWKKLPPERRQQIRERFARWKKMTAEERAELRKENEANGVAPAK